MATLRRKIKLAILAVLVVGIAALAYAMSHDSPCQPGPALAEATATMKAVVRRCYGPPDVLSLEEIAKPVPRDNQLLVRIHAASINPADWHNVRGEPYLMRIDGGFGTPKNPRVGIDFAGVVEAVGKGVTRFKPGDEVFGGGNGSLAEYIVIKEDGNLARKPASIGFEEAAAVNVGALTSLQALRDGGGVKPGDQVLINGSSGGVGTYAVQLAKWLGAEVTAVCSTRNVELVRSLGADRIIDYTQEDFTQTSERYDVVMDNVVNRPILQIRRILKPEGKYLIVGGGAPDANPWIGAIKAPIKAMVTSWFVDEELKFFLSHVSGEDLRTIAGLLESGELRSVIDRRYPLAEAAEAMRYLEAGRARGKVIITIGG
jgi:NADPH:quinone reductase-like Zn-dependent oxidoreductase